MKHLRELLESKDYAEFENDNSDILIEANRQLEDFKKYLKNFIFTNAEEFVNIDNNEITENSLEETYKNIAVFTEFAVAQFTKELSHICASEIYENAEYHRSSMSDYI